jgi:hypothetical protein
MELMKWGEDNRITGTEQNRTWGRRAVESTYRHKQKWLLYWCNATNKSDYSIGVPSQTKVTTLLVYRHKQKWLLYWCTATNKSDYSIGVLPQTKVTTLLVYRHKQKWLLYWCTATNKSDCSIGVPSQTKVTTLLVYRHKQKWLLYWCIALKYFGPQECLPHVTDPLRLQSMLSTDFTSVAPHLMEKWRTLALEVFITVTTRTHNCRTHF